MDSLTIMGLILFFGGLLIFSFKLSSYNRQKYGGKQDNQTDSASRSSLQLLSLIILALALFIFYVFGNYK